MGGEAKVPLKNMAISVGYTTTRIILEAHYVHLDGNQAILDETMSLVNAHRRGK